MNQIKKMATKTVKCKQSNLLNLIFLTAKILTLQEHKMEKIFTAIIFLKLRVKSNMNKTLKLSIMSYLIKFLEKLNRLKIKTKNSRRNYRFSELTRLLTSKSRH